MLLGNVEVETILAMRLIRASLLVRVTSEAIDHLEDMIEMLKRELDQASN